MNEIEEKAARVVYRIFGQSGYSTVKNIYKSFRALLEGSIDRTNPSLKYYLDNFERFGINENLVLIECVHGKTFSGNVFYLARELERAFPEKKIVISSSNKKRINKILNFYQMNFETVEIYSKKYNMYLLQAKYLINDSVFPEYFIKREGQVYLNTWHGTPLKAMGRSIKGDVLSLSNTQRSLIQADIISLNNDQSIKMVKNDYMLSPIKDRNILKLPSARNSVFFDSERRSQLRRILKISDGRKIVLWMPTWRGGSAGYDDIAANMRLMARMKKIMRKLDTSIDLYMHVHPLLKGKIKPETMGMKSVPEEVEIYDFANISDALLTDYSSVMFDYAVSSKPIILDLHDMQEYEKERGFTVNISSLPFTKAYTEEELIDSISTVFNHSVDYSEFNEIYNPLEGIDSPGRVLNELFNYNGAISDNVNNVLIFPGNLSTNGITTSFLNLISSIDRTKRNYYIWLPREFVTFVSERYIRELFLSDINCIISPAGMLTTKHEKRVYKKYLNGALLTMQEENILEKIMTREIGRVFDNIEFEYVIHFSGYEAAVAKIFSKMGSKFFIWVHNNMDAEYEMKRNFNKRAIKSAYEDAEKIIIVNESLLGELSGKYFSEKDIGKIVVVHNSINIENILSKSEKYENYIDSELLKILNDIETIKFINIGRFSPEKGQLRLIEAYESIQKGNPDRKMALFLVGGYGIALEEIRRKVNRSPCRENIYIFENINPLPLLKKCNLFVLSSYHEGLPMVFFESIVLGTTILSTDIPGPREFLQSGYGYLCENSTKGIATGMQEYIDGRLPEINKSLDDFNCRAIMEFESLFD